MEMMLESMGIQTDAIKQLLDPKNVKALLQKVETMCDMVQESNERLKRIEIKLETMDSKELEKLLSDGMERAQLESSEYVREYNGGNSGNNSTDFGTN
jgi:hypothetical protein